MKLQENILLKDYTTFKVGGAARYFAHVSKADELTEILMWAEKNNVRYFILGGGSNLVFMDSGFDGVVIHPQFLHLEQSDTTVTVGASVILADLVTYALSRGLVGMEFAAGIPGTVGGALRGNAGTYGISIGDVTASVHVIDGETFRARSFNRSECSFSYRHSMFKNHVHTIVGADIELQKGDTAASSKIIDDRIAIRHANHPLEPSAGCIFKNIELNPSYAELLLTKGVETEHFKKYMKIPAGYLIEKLGLKGKQIGGAQISPRHANYIINTGSATAEDIVTLISYIKQRVRDSFGIQLEEEVHIVA